jgi:hypothetical protein
VGSGRSSQTIENKPAPAAHSQQQVPKPDASTSDDLESIWSKVQRIAQGTPFTQSLVEPLKLTTFADGRAVLSMHDRSHFKFAQARSKDLGELFKQALGKAVKVSFKLDANAPKVDLKSLKEDDRKAMNHPLVKQVQELFGAQIASVERLTSKQEKSP